MGINEKYILELFGQNIALTTNDGDREDLKNISDYFKSVVVDLQESLPTKSQLNIAILAGLKITDELYSYIKANNIKPDSRKKKEAEVKSDGEILNKIDSAIKQLEISLKL